MMALTLFTDTFGVLDVNQLGKYYDDVCRIDCQSDRQSDCQSDNKSNYGLIIDVNTRLISLQQNDKFVASIYQDDLPESDKSAYVMSGIVMKISYETESDDSCLNIIMSFGGLLAKLSLPCDAANNFVVDQNIFISIGKVTE